MLSDGDFLFQKALHVGGVPLLVWTRARIQCHHALEWSLYKSINEGRVPSLRLDVGCSPCAHCGVDVGAENGLEDWKKEMKKAPALDIAPLCSKETCRSYGWVTKAKRKPNQVKVAQQKRAAKRKRLEEHRRSGSSGGSAAAAGAGESDRIIRPNAVAHASMGGGRPRSSND